MHLTATPGTTTYTVARIEGEGMVEFAFLTGDDVAELASIEEYIAAVRDAYRQRGLGGPAIPANKMSATDPPGILKTYFAILPETGVMGGYVAGFGPDDCWVMTPLYDVETGKPIALLDGMRLNAPKTAAVGAVAVDALARPDASVLGVFGSGGQARAQLRATATVRDLSLVRVYSPTRAHREQFAEEFTAELGIPVRAVDTSDAVLPDADILITATTADSPVFDGANVEPGTHITAMGRYHPDKHELDPTVVANAKYIPDLRDRALQDAGAFLQALDAGLITQDHIHAELGQVIAGTRPGRESPDELTVFDSGGCPIETVAAAHMLYEKATKTERSDRRLRLELESYQTVYGESNPFGGW